MSKNYLMPTYARQPLTFVRGEGVWLWDTEGRVYLDGISGIAVSSLGHAHPSLLAAVRAQLEKLIHISNLYQIAEQAQLAEVLCQLAQMDNAFFCNSGCEANEAAIKLARLYGHQRGIERPEIIVMEHAFHGRTLTTLSATGNRKVQAGFEPLVSGFVRVPYDDLEAVQQVASLNHNVVAVLVEPVQGEAGVRIPRQMSAYLEGLRDICTAQNWLLMLDEVQTGVGRTGAWFAFQHSGIQADVITLAKGLGGGVPIGACLARNEAARIFSVGKHGSTFGGNPFAMSAGLAVLQTIQQEKLVAHARAMGDLIAHELSQNLSATRGIVSIRHLGLMLGIELDRMAGELVGIAREEGLLINVTDERTVRLLPPLIITADESHELVNRLTRALQRFLQA